MITLHFTYGKLNMFIVQDKKGQWHYNINCDRLEKFQFEPFANYDSLQECFEEAIKAAAEMSQLAEDIREINNYFN